LRLSLSLSLNSASCWIMSCDPDRMETSNALLGPSWRTLALEIHCPSSHKDIVRPPPDDARFRELMRRTDESLHTSLERLREADELLKRPQTFAKSEKPAMLAANFSDRSSARRKRRR
jgi:hypothetical protein